MTIVCDFVNELSNLYKRGSNLYDSEMSHCEPGIWEVVILMERYVYKNNVFSSLISSPDPSADYGSRDDK